MKKLTTLITSKITLVFLANICCLLYFNTVFAQNYNGLKELSGYKNKIYYSVGADVRAKSIAKNVAGAQKFLSVLVNFDPTVTILVLNPEDWSKFAESVIYGMPHYNDKDKALNIASEDNAFWESFIPPLDKLPKDLADQIKKAYSDKNGNLSMQPFFDLLAIHELGHAYHIQGGLKMQRNWMGELFSNISLHTYIAEREPKLLLALTAFPQMVIAGDKSNFKYTSLTDFENNYDELGSKYPQNYGWYQCRLHAASAKIYDAGGTKLYKRLWTTLKTHQEALNDNELTILLAKNVGQPLADTIINWDK